MWFILFLLFPAFADSVEVGNVCDTIEQCGSLMECRNGRCTCDIANANMIPVFIAPGLQTGVSCAEKVKCDYRTSPKKLCTGGHCILEKGEFHGACGCEENQMMTVNSIDNTTCWPYRKKFFNTICGHANPMCDEMKGLICRSSRCLCKEDEMYNFTSQECLSQKPYLEEFNLTVYQGRWGEYCIRDNDCLGILECAINKTCECPYDCDGYVEEHKSCYCGDREFPTGPVLIGIFIGFLIICFWCYQIDKLCKKYQNRPHNPRPGVTLTGYEEVEREEDVRPTEPPVDDLPPQYDSTIAVENVPVPSAPPLPEIDNDRNSVNNQPVLLRKRKSTNQ